MPSPLAIGLAVLAGGAIAVSVEQMNARNTSEAQVQVRLDGFNDASDVQYSDFSHTGTMKLFYRGCEFGTNFDFKSDNQHHMTDITNYEATSIAQPKGELYLNCPIEFEQAAGLYEGAKKQGFNC